MRRIAIITAATVFIILLCARQGYPDQAGQPMRHVIILIDLSDSPLHVTSEQYAAKLGKYMAEEILNNIPLGTKVELRSFGEYNRSKNLVSLSFQALNKPGHRPFEIASTIGTLLSKLPRIIKRGRLELQKMTCLLGELKIIAQRLDPNDQNLVVIVSDMLEYSDISNAYALVVQRDGGLPSPRHGLLANAHVTALGAGYGLKNSKQNDRLQDIWAAWFEKAGVSEFRYLSDF